MYRTGHEYDIIDKMVVDIYLDYGFNNFPLDEKMVCSSDMVGGYLRIYDNAIKKWVLFDGTPADAGEGHYKIKRREDM